MPADAKYSFQKYLKTSFQMTGLESYVTSAAHSNHYHIYVEFCWCSSKPLSIPQWVATGRSWDPCCTLS